MPSYEQVTYNGPDGAQIGQSASELISFHGATPVAQASFIATVTASTTLSQIVVQVNSILTLLSAKGLMASS